MFQQIKEYEKLKKSDDIIWYFKIKDSGKFDVLKNREMTFSDEFESDSLDTKKWITNYFWGEKLLKDRYSIEPDLQAFTEKENIEIRNSVLKIVTKPQKISGKSMVSHTGLQNQRIQLFFGDNKFRVKLQAEIRYVQSQNQAGKSFSQKFFLDAR